LKDRVVDDGVSHGFGEVGITNSRVVRRENTDSLAGVEHRGAVTISEGWHPHGPPVDGEQDLVMLHKGMVPALRTETRFCVRAARRNRMFGHVPQACQRRKLAHRSLKPIALSIRRSGCLRLAGRRPQ
jgi:hypothetical protein